MKLFLGPAGNCILARGEKTSDSLKNLARLGLNAQEIEFVRGVYMGKNEAKSIGGLAKKLGIRLSVHAPYYINLASEDAKKQLESRQRILASAEIGHHLGAREIVFHPAYFGKFDREKVFQITKEHILDMRETLRKKEWDVVLSPETTGKHSALGSLDEIIRLVKETGCGFTIDFAHLYARNGGRIEYKDVLDKLHSQLKPKHMHCHFSNISWTSKGERNHEILDHRPPFGPLAKELLRRRTDCTLISESPITWKDALKMKAILEREGYTWKK
jgi:deoxyribonuclease-4